MTTFFEPRSRREHNRANAGYGNPDYCSNCHRPFMDHCNGVCPNDEHDDALESAEIGGLLS